MVTPLQLGDVKTQLDYLTLSLLIIYLEQSDVVMWLVIFPGSSTNAGSNISQDEFEVMSQSVSTSCKKSEENMFQKPSDFLQIFLAGSNGNSVE
ncbi:hypothetical protein AVEN_73662-1 [Araneus ventricosus]|uniref:Uncharacterized protein n=1 Tax=Araneus ventricosus TaxID=182803 RepID=A0A4Y2HQ35_ARAVE|nr:hypothetical protein AVEN_73662-1 [Araneus ventricosus]